MCVFCASAVHFHPLTLPENACLKSIFERVRCTRYLSDASMIKLLGVSEFVDHLLSTMQVQLTFVEVWEARIGSFRCWWIFWVLVLVNGCSRRDEPTGFG